LRRDKNGEHKHGEFQGPLKQRCFLPYARNFVLKLCHSSDNVEAERRSRTASASGERR
jgi:hypothetical protein